MDITKQYREQQEAKQLQSKISAFIGDFRIGTLLNKSGIRKLRGVSPLKLFEVIFMLSFEGVRFSQGIVKKILDWLPEGCGIRFPQESPAQLACIHAVPGGHGCSLFRCTDRGRAREGLDFR